MSCDYQYDTQPAQTALSCSKLTAFALRCQVSSDNSDFSIGWHYSNSEPDSIDIPTAMKIDNSRNIIISNVWNYSDVTNVSLLSELTLSEINEKDNIDGYYWCSVNSSNETNTTTPNPSVVLHILHHIECTAKVESKCGGQINFYSSLSTPRCADQNISVDIVEAQNCTTGDRLEPTTMQTTRADMDNFGLQNMTGSTITPIITTKAPSLPLTLGIIAGASMGGLIFMLFIIIGLLLMCMVRMKVNKHRKSGNQVDPITPFDDICMYSSEPAIDKDTMDDSCRTSKLVLEANLSYECPQAITSTSQTNENVYACIN